MNESLLTDAALLDRLAGGDRSALAEIAERHIDLVHAAARRQTRDAHQADDVTQAVFLTLCRKAGSIRKGTHLVGWLYMATRNIAMTARRAAARRERYERAARASDRTQPAEGELAPLLDDALAGLAPSDREAVLLRFFSKLPFAAVADRLGTSEEGARKRVVRAVDKLRARLVSQGATASAAAVTALLTSESLRAAPSTTLTSVTGAASVNATSLAASSVAVGGAKKLAIAAIVLLLGGAAATTMLLAGQSPRTASAASTLAPTAAPDTAQPSTSDSLAMPVKGPWFEAFKKTYALGEGEVLKHVPPPFIPERLDFYWFISPRQAEAIPDGPSYMLLGAKLDRDICTMGFTGPRYGAGVEGVLSELCGLRRFEYTLFKGAERSDVLVGDWVCDTSAPLEKRLAALAAAVNEELGVNASFVPHEREEDAVVITATRPNRDPKPVDIKSDVGRSVAYIQQAGRLSAVLDTISFSSRWAMFDERPAPTTPADRIDLALKHEGAKMRLDSGERSSRVDVEALMNVIAKESGFEFKIEKRKFTVWELTAN